MIHHITFKNPKKTELPSDIHANYAFSLKALRGKTFEFKPGTNVIVGRNASGKTTLLNVIRCLMFCDELFGSSIADNRGYWELHLDNNFEKGFWHLAEMEADYRTVAINLRKMEDMRHGTEMDSFMGLAQTLHGYSRSRGQQSLGALNMMMQYVKQGEAHSDSKKDSKSKPHLSFRKMVLDIVDAHIGKSNEYYTEIFKTIQAYYKRNHIGDAEYADKYKGLTFLMDEPEIGMDIYNIEDVYKFLFCGSASVEKSVQTIIVLHNVGMIHKLLQRKDVNFIELTPGYLEAVEGFFKESGAAENPALMKA